MIGFKVEVRLHQGSALSPLVNMVMDRLTYEVREEQVKENHWNLWNILEEEELNSVVARQNTCMNEREASGTWRFQGVEAEKANEFKSFGSSVQSNGELGKEMKRQVHAGWIKLSGVICDKRIATKVKGK